MWSQASWIPKKEVATCGLLQSHNRPNPQICLPHPSTWLLLRSWNTEVTSDTLKKQNYSGNLFSADLSSFLFHVSFLWFYFSLIFLHWLKEFRFRKELWLTFTLMISFPSYGLVRPELEKVLCCLLTKLGIPAPLPPQPLSCSGSSTSHFSLYSPVLLCSQFAYWVLWQ